MRWQLQEAKAQFSQVIREAKTSGPQVITVHNKPSAVVISHEEYLQLKGRKKSFVEFMQESPLYGLELEIERDRSPDRDIEF